MKREKWMLPVTLLLLSGLLAAQSLTQSSVKAQVPFDFIVNNKIILAGECVVGSAGLNGKILSIRNVDARTSALSVSSAGETRRASENTMLVFRRYGSQYFLSSVRLEGSARTYQLQESRAEAELRAQNVPASETILLASLK